MPLLLVLFLLLLVFTGKSIGGGSNVTLREAGKNRGIYIGSNANHIHIENDGVYAEMLGEQFSIVYPENECLFEIIEPEQNIFNFTLCDTVLDYANKHDQLYAADHLIWGADANPKWLLYGNFTPGEKENILVNHITKIMQYYGDKIYSWNVVNELSNLTPVSEQTDGKNHTNNKQNLEQFLISQILKVRLLSIMYGIQMFLIMLILHFKQHEVSIRMLNYFTMIIWILN